MIGQSVFNVKNHGISKKSSGMTATFNIGKRMFHKTKNNMKNNHARGRSLNIFQTQTKRTNNFQDLNEGLDKIPDEEFLKSNKSHKTNSEKSIIAKKTKKNSTTIIETVEKDDILSDCHLENEIINEYENGQIHLNKSFISKFSSEKSSKESKQLLGYKKSKMSTLGEASRFIFTQKSKLFDRLNFHDTKELEFLFVKYNYNSALLCVVSLISISSALIEYEISFNNNSKNNFNLISENKSLQKLNLDTLNLFALWIYFISSLILWTLMIYEYLIYCRILYHTKKVAESIWRTEKTNLTILILTLIIFFLHPNPLFKDYKVQMYNLKYEITINYSLNSIFGLISLLRLWFFVKFFLAYSEFFSPRAQRVCEMNNFDTNLTFSMKASMVKSPYIAYFMLFLIILMFCSFGLRIFERELDIYSGINMASYWNVVWCLIITMTTVGYGDYYPSTLFGRIIGIISCICGVFLISMLIVTITNVLNFEGNEKTVFLLLERIHLMEEKDLLAARLISRYVKLMKLFKKADADHKEKDDLREQVLLNLLHFREKCNEISATYPPYSNYDNILDYLEDIDRSLEDVQSKYKELQNDIYQ